MKCKRGVGNSSPPRGQPSGPSSRTAAPRPGSHPAPPPAPLPLDRAALQPLLPHRRPSSPWTRRPPGGPRSLVLRVRPRDHEGRACQPVLSGHGLVTASRRSRQSFAVGGGASPGTASVVTSPACAGAYGALLPASSPCAAGKPAGAGRDREVALRSRRARRDPATDKSVAHRSTFVQRKPVSCSRRADLCHRAVAVDWHLALQISAPVLARTPATAPSDVYSAAVDRWDFGHRKYRCRDPSRCNVRAWHASVGDDTDHARWTGNLRQPA